MSKIEVKNIKTLSFKNMSVTEEHHFTSNPNENSLIVKMEFGKRTLYDMMNNWVSNREFLYGTSRFKNQISRGQLYWHDNLNFFSSIWSNKDHVRWQSQPHSLFIKSLQVHFNNIQRSYVQEWNRNHIKHRLDEKHFNSTQINKYIGPNDSIGAHADDQPDFGENPTIMIWSVGVPRKLRFLRLLYNPLKPRSKKIDTSFEPLEINMTPNSVLIMAGTTQKNFLHEIEKDPSIRETDVRHSVTFREHNPVSIL